MVIAVFALHRRGPADRTSTYSTFPLSISEYYLQVSAVRISSSYIPRRHWRPSQERLIGRNQLSLDHRDHPALPAYYGDGLGA